MALIVAGISVVQPYILARSAVAVSCGADTSEDILATITVPAGALGINGFLRVFTAWTTTNSANTKTLRARFSGTAGTDFIAQASSNVAAVSHLVTIANRGSASSQIGTRPVWSTVNAALVGAHVTSSVDTTAQTSVVITGQKASSGEILTLESYLVELFPTV